MDFDENTSIFEDMQDIKELSDDILTSDRLYQDDYMNEDFEDIY